MLLAEELLLLGLDPVEGTVVNNARQELLVGLAGALVGELALSGLVDLSGKRFIAVGSPPGDPLLAAAHWALAQSTGRRAAAQLRGLDKGIGGVWSRLVDGLADREVLGRRRDHVAWFAGFPVTRHPVLQPAVREEVLERVRAAAAGEGEIEPRTAVVLALAGPSRLLEVVAPDKASRPHAKRRIETATELTPVAPVVKKVIAEMHAATAAVVSSGGGFGGLLTGGTSAPASGRSGGWPARPSQRPAGSRTMSRLCRLSTLPSTCRTGCPAPSVMSESSPRRNMRSRITYIIFTSGAHTVLGWLTRRRTSCLSTPTCQAPTFRWACPTAWRASGEPSSSTLSDQRPPRHPSGGRLIQGRGFRVLCGIAAGGRSFAWVLWRRTIGVVMCVTARPGHLQLDS